MTDSEQEEMNELKEKRHNCRQLIKSAISDLERNSERVARIALYKALKET